MKITRFLHGSFLTAHALSRSFHTSVGRTPFPASFPPPVLKLRTGCACLRPCQAVVDFQILRKDAPTSLSAPYLSLPVIMSGYSLADGAEAVHSEFPNLWPSELVKHLLGQGAQMDGAIVPQRSRTDFVNTQVLLARARAKMMTLP